MQAVALKRVCGSGTDGDQVRRYSVSEISILNQRIVWRYREERTAIAEERAAEAAKSRATAMFQPLAEAEAEALIGADLLAQVAASARRS
jgi:hypothetical protein